jgi:hypothetical protein
MNHFQLFFFLFFISTVVCTAQTTVEKKTEVTPPIITSTSVSTKKPFLKVIFDDSNSQLIGIDTTGKIIDNAIIAFQLFVTIKGVEHSEQALGSTLNKAMLDLLAQVEQNTILYFEHIQVKNPAGNLIEVEDFQYTLSYLPKKK